MDQSVPTHLIENMICVRLNFFLFFINSIDIQVLLESQNQIQVLQYFNL